MRLRRRVTVMSVLVVGATLVLSGVVCLVVMRNELRGQVDDALRSQGRETRRVAARFNLAAVDRLPDNGGRRAGVPQPYLQLVSPTGVARRPPGSQPDAPLPVTAAARRLAAAGGAGQALEDVHADGVHLRMLTIAVPGDGAVQIARSLRSVDRTLARLRALLALLTLGGIAFAAGLARLLSRPVAAPTEQQLALSAGALADSLAAQRQLVADASHELRTPVTSLRTNAEMLRDAASIDDGERRLLAGEIVDQSEELTGLVGDLIELARGDRPDPATEDVRLDHLLEESVERARRHAGGVEVTLQVEACVVEGAPERLARAINNLLDNAAKHSPDGATIEVALTPTGVVTVRDHGPGIEPTDLPHVFDRFHRGANARGRPGSGLGLAIVRQVAEAHGGTVGLAPAPGGGTLATLALPAIPVARAALR